MFIVVYSLCDGYMTRAFTFSVKDGAREEGGLLLHTYREANNAADKAYAEAYESDGARVAVKEIFTGKEEENQKREAEAGDKSYDEIFYGGEKTLFLDTVGAEVGAADAVELFVGGRCGYLFSA